MKNCPEKPLHWHLFFVDQPRGRSIADRATRCPGKASSGMGYATSFFQSFKSRNAPSGGDDAMAAMVPPIWSLKKGRPRDHDMDDWLVVEKKPLKNMNVNWDDEISNIWENIKWQPNHQPDELCQYFCGFNVVGPCWTIKHHVFFFTWFNFHK